MIELWKPLIYRGEDFGDLFEVSNTGKIRNKETGKERSLNSNHEGYLYCVISRGRHRKVAVKAHRAVAENFVDGDKSLSIDHKDGNKHNNNSDNLEFVSKRENNHRAIKNGLYNPFKFTKEETETMKTMRNDGMRISDIARAFDTHRNTVWKILTNQSYQLQP